VVRDKWEFNSPQPSYKGETEMSKNDIAKEWFKVWVLLAFAGFLVILKWY
jgi:hypothetical protein